MASDVAQTDSNMLQSTNRISEISALLPAVCRTCLLAENDVEGELYSMDQIFLEEDSLTSQVQSFENIICLFIDDEMEKTNDRLPRSICMPCVEKARSAFHFIEMCRQTDNVLKECLLEPISIISSNFAQSVIPEETIENDEEILGEYVTEIKHIATEYLDEDELERKSFQWQTTAKDNPIEQLDNIPVNKEPHEKTRVYKNVSAKRHLCEICLKTFTQPQTLNRHKKIHTKDSQPGKSCNYCDRVFLRSDDLRRHIRTHTNERPYVCDQCPRAYKQSAELKEHKESVHPITGIRKMLECTICDKKLTTRNGLYVHMKAHRGEKNHSCSYCSKRFVTSGELTSHLRHIHTEQINAEIIVCGQKGCAKKFVTNAAWRHHQIKKHKVHAEDIEVHKSRK
ncbi:zinc finger and SCAN domain-containing protein 31-like [Toxorhynchites rutilus septentrionalis]|uniref:zinc finger and SCAN domain-containing protein 31-like n=1 Tax=Toxorhynchites rutilus septentrionalis TaxID=329112 RepID=UPI0024791181|nr:zinc finger and SCAN domain-containing protein 31-like [Toxorhynchites rutilus septentrionalis]